jgi:uncharacterized protein YbjT (DUF2867 family)
MANTRVLVTNTRVLVTGATGKIGGAVAAQLLEKGVISRALVHRDDGRKRCAGLVVDPQIYAHVV